jgi:serine protease Do
MNPNNASRPTPGKVLAARRLTLLASVAGIGVAVMLGGPGYGSPTPPAVTSPAQAVETVQHPAGFADLVAKVKPAVVSVRVKIDRTSMSMNENGGE